jgi:hypothetical protein
MMPKELDIDIYDFAAYIAKLCAMKNYFVNLTKLQKLMYYSLPLFVKCNH